MSSPVLSARRFRFEFPRPALVMGVLNVTPDSFSDGGRHATLEAALDRALEMVAQGARIIDVGGESTRPGADPVPEGEELRRVIPVIAGLANRLEVPISVDTMKPAVARAALEAGASIVNDIAANRTDPEMWRVAAGFEAAYVCMHMQGTPRTMQDSPSYTDVVAEVEAFFLERIERMRGCGMESGRIILDPGIGFGKTVEHNLALLGGLGRLARLGFPLLVGVSRKSFMGKLLGAPPGERLAPGLACACLAVAAGTAVIRTHDVAETVQALRMTEAILANQR